MMWALRTLTQTSAPTRTRTVTALGILAGVVLAVSGCINAPVTATANSDGSVTIEWRGTADAYDPVTVSGNRILLCSPGANTCVSSSPELLFILDPASGSTDTTISVGTSVLTTSAESVALPAGSYAFQVQSYGAGSEISPMSEALEITVARLGQRPTWFQSFARDDDTAECPNRWSPSWAEWPNDGTGGYVCTRLMFADVDDEQVPDGPRAAGGAPWLQSLPRGSMDAECPDGWSRSWAEWPNDGAGGPVCNRDG